MSLVSQVTSLAQAIGADIKSLNVKKNRDRLYTNTAATGTITLDLALYDSFDLTLTGNITLAWSNIPTLTSEAILPVVSLTCGTTGYTTTWMSGISEWLNSGGIAPAGPTASKKGVFAFPYNGTSWIGIKGPST